MHWSTTKREHASYVCADAHSTITLQNAQASVQILHTNQEGNTTWYACTHTAPPKKFKQITHSTTSSIHTVHTLHQHISHAPTATHHSLSDSLPDTHSFSLQTHAPPLCFAAFLENDRPQPLPCAPTWENAKGSTCLFRRKIGKCRCRAHHVDIEKCRHRKDKDAIYCRKYRKSISDLRRCKTHCRKLLNAFWKICISNNRRERRICPSFLSKHKYRNLHIKKQDYETWYRAHTSTLFARSKYALYERKHHSVHRSIWTQDKSKKKYT